MKGLAVPQYWQAIRYTSSNVCQINGNKQTF